MWASHPYIDTESLADLSEFLLASYWEKKKKKKVVNNLLCDKQMVCLQGAWMTKTSIVKAKYFC